MPFRPKIHHKCRNTFYSTTQIERFRVPDDKVHFDIDFPAYKPVYYSGNGDSKSDTSFKIEKTGKFRLKFFRKSVTLRRCVAFHGRSSNGTPGH